MDFEVLAAQNSRMIHSIYHSLNVYKNYDEFFQIGLVALWEASQNFDESKGQFSTYAYSFIKGRMLTHLNKMRKHENDSIDLGIDWLDIAVYEENYLEKERLLSHFHKLTALEKQWVLQRYYEGMTDKEIAEINKVNLSSVRSCGRRAISKFIKQE